jgi:hypothetical protein
VRGVSARPEDESIEARRLFDATGAGCLKYGQEHALYEIGGEILAVQVTQAIQPDTRPEAPTELALCLVLVTPLGNVEDEICVGNVCNHHQR